jgi:heat shock protein HtpX
MKFLTRSLLILLALYGLVFAVGDWYLARAGVSLWGAVAFAVGFVLLQYLIGPWLIETLLAIFWDDAGTQLPARNREFIKQLCAQRGLKAPRIGIIESSTPNAFSFGHIPSNSRVVVTTGLLDVLTTEEANAVLAHEIGHIEHWDFIVMTIAALAPLLLYQLYTFTHNINQLRAIAYTAYLCYWISQFVVLLLNRTREYFADHYAAEVTREPDALASALVKIAYGMVKSEGEYQEAMQSDKDKSQYRRDRRLSGAMGVMGISNLHAGSALALSGADPTQAAAVMRWDLVNPWARLYQLNSTHPLTALRVQALNQQAEGIPALSRYPLPQDRDIRWGTFPIEVLVWAAPWIGAAALGIVRWEPQWLRYAGFTVTSNLQPILLIFIGVTWILRIWCRYHGKYEPSEIGTLIQDVEVSEMLPRAVQLKGEILGRGVPGAFWSADLVLRDATGILFVLYRQSIPLARFLFAMTEAENYIGQSVEIEGWFRRGLRPYVEMSCITGPDGKKHRSYSRWIQFAIAAAVVGVGCAWFR